MFEEENLINLNESFNELNKIREECLTISREIVQLSSKCIRSIHRDNFEIALNYIESASEKLIKLKQISKKVSEISYAGYVLDAEREYVEAVLFFKFEESGTLEPFKNFEVHPSSYIQGIGDTIGEWRRKALEMLRKLEIDQAEKYLMVMEDSLEILNQLDYPDALTGGLRRYADNARSIIERTRSDITNAFINESLRIDLSKIKKDEI